MRFLFLLLFFISSIFGANLKIIASENLAFMVEKVINSFYKENPDIKIDLIKSSTYDISLKIKNGVLADLAISDDASTFDMLYKEGFLEKRGVFFAKNDLVVFSYKKKLDEQNLKILKNNSIKNITLLNPFENTEGKLAIEALKNNNLYREVKKKFIYANSLEKLLSYALHVSDVAIGTKSALLLPSFQKHKNQLNFFSLQKKSSLVAALVKRYKPNKNAQIFLQFLKSEDAKKILTKSGYTF